MSPKKDTVIAAALADYDAGIFKSLSAAALHYGVARSSLSRRIHGKTRARAVVAEAARALSADLEASVVQWIVDCERAGAPVTQEELRTFVELLLRARGETAPLGKCWIRRFLRRNPTLRSKMKRTTRKDKKYASSTETKSIYEEPSLV